MSQKPIVHIGTLYAKPEYTDSLIRSFEGLKQAPGYISHECFRDIEDNNKLTLVERWESRKDHETREIHSLRYADRCPLRPADTSRSYHSGKLGRGQNASGCLYPRPRWQPKSRLRQ